MKEKSGWLYPLVNFFGIHLFPTVIVFICLLPVYFAVEEPLWDLRFLDVVAFMVCITAVIIEFVADEQQRTFRRERTREVYFCQSGLWSYSRHPNYFGEVLFWWGIYLYVLAANPAYWWTLIGAVAMTLMFCYVSIPMMEKHLLAKYPDYIYYQESVPALIPWYKKIGV